MFAEIEGTFEETTEYMTEIQLTFQSALQSSFSVLGSAFHDLMMGVEHDWDETLKRMAAAFLSSLVSSLLMRAASSIVGGPAGIVMNVGQMGAARPALGMAPVVYHLHIEGDIIGTNQFVTDTLVPKLEHAIQAGRSRIAMRSVG